MKFRHLTFAAITLLCSFQSVSGEEYTLLPQPQSIQYAEGKIALSEQPVISFPKELAGEARLLAAYLETDFDVNAIQKKNKSQGDIILTIDPKVLPDKKESYIMDAFGSQILIKAATPAGVLHGIQTLRQALKKENGKLTLQKATVTDYPAFAWRAFMLDEGRYFKGKEVVFNLLDRMAELKMNVFHWHLTDDQGWRIEIKKYPKLTEVGAFRDSTEINHFSSNVYDGKPHGGFYTQQDVKEIVAYAAERHIMVVPEIEMPGHASAAIAAYPWLGTSGKQIKVPCKFGVQYDVFNVADPRVMQFLEDVMDEVIALFPSPVFHIGGDEVRYNQWKASSAVQAYMKEHNINTPAGLQVFFTNKVSNLLAGKNRRMMGWNEITGAQVNEYQQGEKGESNQKLAKGTIVQFWKGAPQLVKETIEKGYDVVNSNNAYTYLDYGYNSISLERAYRFNPIPAGLTEVQQKRVIGLGCQMWGEFIPTVESMNFKIYPRIAAYAETGWCGEKQKDYPRFLRALPYFLDRWKEMGIKYGPVK